MTRRYLCLLVAGALGLNLLVAGLSLFSLERSKQQFTKRAAVTAQNLAQILEQNISGIVNKADIGVFALAKEVERQIASGGINQEKLQSYMMRSDAHLPELEGLRVANSQGKVIYGLKPSAGSFDAADRDYFIRLRDNPREQLVVSKPIQGRITGKWIIVVARRISGLDGSFAGVAFGSISVNRIIESLFSSIDVGKFGAFALRDGSDLALVARYPDPGGNAVGQTKMSREFQVLFNQGITVGSYEAPSGLDRRIRTWGYRKFGNNLYYIFVGLARDEYLAEWRSDALETCVFLALFCLVSCVAAGAMFQAWNRNRTAEVSLRANDEKMRLFFERQIVGMAISSPDKFWTQVNDKMCGIFGYERDELLQTTWAELTYPDDLPLNLEKFDQLQSGAINDYTMINRFVRKDGSVVAVDMSVGCARNEDGSLDCLLAIMEDVTEKESTKEKLKVTELKYQTLFENMSDGFAAVDMAGAIAECNGAFCGMIGYDREEVKGLSYEAITPEKWHEFEKGIVRDQVMVRGFSEVYEKEYLCKDGALLPVDLRVCLTRDGEGRPAGMWAIIRDISERKRTEAARATAEERERQQAEKLLHSQKLESLGVLAGGIAHDFNNILTAIIGNADLALMRLNPESPVLDNLHQIEQAAVRAADLARQMLAYSGKGKFVIESIDLNRLVEEMLHMLEVSISKKAALRLNPLRPLPTVEGDATQLRQVIMNLVINASEAIADRTGEIAISTGIMECTKDFFANVWFEESLSPGSYVYLDITDTGCGMDKETMAKIFEPFFTTKFTGRGLGMAAVLGIVRGHRGLITVSSQPREGSSFKVLLPVGGKSEQSPAVADGKVNWRGNGTVLLADDEEAIRDLGKQMLRVLGFQVVTANDGRQAVEIFSAREDISFVILDLTMPHLDGEQAFRELRRIRPDVKVFLSSGYNEQEVTKRFIGQGLAGFVQKPYKLSDLTEVLSRMAWCP